MSKLDESIEVPLVDLTAQYAEIREEVCRAIQGVVEAQQFILGAEVELLEREIGGYSQCQFAIGVSSGTDAILVSLMALEIGPGDEVVTTPYTFFSTVGCVARLGAKAVFVDIEPETYNIDAGRVEGVLTGRTRAVLPVHLYGQMAEMAPIEEIARRRNLYIIEDAAQAIGAEYRGRRAGAIGHLGCLSFFPSKNLGAFGDAGMVTSNEERLSQRVKLLRSHGASPKYYHRLVGGNFRLDAIQAAVLRVKFKYLDGWTAARQQNAARYRELFAAAGLVAERGEISSKQGARGVVLPKEAGDRRHIYNQFVIRVAQKHRDALIEHLKRRGVATEIYYPVPLHLQECFRYLGYRAGDFPESEAAARETIALPIYPELTEAKQRTVVGCVAEYFAH